MLQAEKRSGRWYSRKRGFAEARKKAYSRDGDYCRVSGRLLVTRCDIQANSGRLLKKIEAWQRACDHIWPERYVRRFIPGANPHILENLLTVHPSIHAKKTAAEKYLYSGNWHSYKQALDVIGYPMDLVSAAMKALQASAEKS